MITDPGSGRPRCQNAAGFNPSRDDHGRRLGRPGRPDPVSIPPGMITDHERSGVLARQAHVSIPPGMITDQRGMARRQSRSGFNPSRDDHGRAKRMGGHRSGDSGFNPSRDDHGQVPRLDPTDPRPSFNPSRDDHGPRPIAPTGTGVGVSIPPGMITDLT